ncbi:MAG: NAD-dependent deacylase [Candidatus Lambdaproteobacteria bacterium]|nr:NAD-dependent deacylase [Candidatus Lambdaproteobacteria bacterium]
MTVSPHRGADFEQAARALAGASKAIALTGAGVSVPSGIPDFRSATGLWLRYPPAEYATLSAFRADPAKVWRMFAELERMLQRPPNPAHRALATLEAEGGLAGIVTQNIDGLHQRAGSRTVIEYHGSPATFTCLACGAGYTLAEVLPLERPPRCPAPAPGGRCGQLLKPDVVLFDEQIPGRALAASEALVRDVDLMLIVGTSCEVYPAAELPRRVRRQGGLLIELNLAPAAGLDPDVLVRGDCAVTLPRLLEGWRQARGRPGGAAP